MRDGRVGQPLAAVPLYGCRIPLAGKGCVRDYARRRVSERNRRKAALSAEITQERFPAPLKSNIFRTFTSSENKGNGEKRFFRPVAPPVFGGKAHGNRLGRRWKAKRRRGWSGKRESSYRRRARPVQRRLLFLRGGMGDFTKKEPLFAGIRKISSEIQKSSCIVHRCTVYDLIAKKRPDTEGMLAGAVPVTFHVEKRTFRADGHARRGKYATLNQ